MYVFAKEGAFWHESIVILWTKRLVGFGMATQRSLPSWCLRKA